MTIDPDTLYVVCFYINGAADVHTSEIHVTPWSDLAACRVACRAYLADLNVWWDSLFPGDLYLDEVSGGLIEDLNHPNTRIGLLPGPPNDGHPTEPSGTYLQEWGDGLDWITL